MKGKHPIRICIEVLLVLALAGGVVRMYFFRADEEADQKGASREVSRMMKEHAGSGGADSTRVFGKEVLGEGLEGEDVNARGEESSILVFKVVYAASGEPALGPFDLVSDDCGWRESYPSSTIKLIVQPGVCSYRVESLKGLVSEVVVLDVGPGEVLTETLPVYVTLVQASEGGVEFTWVRHLEWIEIATLPAGGELARAGLQQGDVILEVAGVSVRGLDDVALAKLLVGRMDEPVVFLLAAPTGEGWDEVPVVVPRESLSL